VNDLPPPRLDDAVRERAEGGAGAPDERADASLPDDGGSARQDEQHPVEARFTCAARLEVARTELLRAHFDPAKDTPTWLQTSAAEEDGGVMLRVYTVYSPDGDGLRVYSAEVAPSRRNKHGWRLTSRMALDEFKEERLPERTWTRVHGDWAAQIHTRTEARALVDLFELIVRPALDDCLDHPGQIGEVKR
jgi:hypothetical protein